MKRGINYSVTIVWIVIRIVCSLLMSIDCYSSLENIACQQDNKSTIFYNKTCQDIGTVCSILGWHDNGNATHCFNVTSGEAKLLSELYHRVLSSEEYFRYGIHCRQRCIVSGGSVTSLTPLFSVEERDKNCWGSRLQACNCRSRPETQFSVCAGPHGTTSAACDGNYSDTSL